MSSVEVPRMVRYVCSQGAVMMPDAPCSPVRVTLPEEVELQRKRRLLDRLTSTLVRNEERLETLRCEAEALRQRHLAILGPLYAQLDSLRAEIAECKARMNPSSCDAASFARARAEQSARDLEDLPNLDAILAAPSHTLKRLFREVARRLHPDLSSDPNQRERRHILMARANDLYSKGDEVGLRLLLDEDVPAEPEAASLGDALIHVIRQLASVRLRLRRTVAEHAALLASDGGLLRKRTLEAAAKNHNLLDQLKNNLLQQISEHQNVVERLRQQR